MTGKVDNPNQLLGDLAYESVRKAILSNELGPGERVSEYKVAKWLNISRTPAREGLRRLESDGLLQYHPRRGLVVATINDKAFEELYAVRELLEGAAAAMAARNAKESELSELKHLVELEARMLDDPARMYTNNRSFHGAIYEAAHNQFLRKFLFLMADIVSAYRGVSTLHDETRRKEVVVEHRKLYDAIAARDEDLAKSIAVQHVRNAFRARVKVRRDAEKQDRKQA